MVRSAKVTIFALVHHCQQVNGMAGKIKTPDFFKSNKLCLPPKNSTTTVKVKLWKYPTLREAFLSVLSTSPSKNGMANELRSCQDREEKLMSYINVFFLPSEHPMIVARGFISEVPTALPILSAGKQ